MEINLEKVANLFGKEVEKGADLGNKVLYKFKDGSTCLLYGKGEFEKENIRIHDENIQTLIKCSDNKLLEILVFCNEIIEKEPTVSSYLQKAEEIMKLLEEAYKEVGPPNSFHYDIKGLDPEIYGRAETFMKQISSLMGTVQEVLTAKGQTK